MWLLIPFLLGCSVYQSDGRKFVESQGLQWAGYSALANLQTCDHELSRPAWLMIESNPRADLYVYEGDGYQMRVQPVQDETFSCYYRFASAQELYEKTSDAVALTMTKLDLSNSLPKTR